MDTHIWKKLRAFLYQPLPEDLATIQLLERCWNTFYIQDAEPDLDLQLLERCWNMPCNQEIQLDLQLLERCWGKSCVQPQYDR
jgi:hypothetical protein